MNFVEIEAVDLRYGAADPKQSADLLALSNASLSIRAGEFAAVVGPSGCGKSTLLKLVAGLVRPTRGSVKARGEEIRRPLHKVGMAFQNATLLPWRSVLDNVLLPLEIAPQPFGRGAVSQVRRAGNSPLYSCFDALCAAAGACPGGSHVAASSGARYGPGS